MIDQVFTSVDTPGVPLFFLITLCTYVRWKEWGLGWRKGLFTLFLKAPRLYLAGIMEAGWKGVKIKVVT